MIRKYQNKLSNNFLFIPGIIILFFYTGCSEHIEPAPFYDGLHLTYHETFGKTGKPETAIWTRYINYKFTKNDIGNFLVSQKVTTEKNNSPATNFVTIPFPEVQDNLTLDKYGIVLKGGDFINFINNEASYLWLPPDKRKTGNQVITYLRKVSGKQQWEKWDVITVKGALGDTYNYDEDTGLLVGAESSQGKLKLILTDSENIELQTNRM